MNPTTMTKTEKTAAPRPHAWRPAALLLAAATGTAALSGCVPLIVGGAVVGTSLVVTDRRSSGAQLDDQAIELKGMRRVDEAIGGRGSVSVTSYNRIVLLTGSTANEADKATIARSISTIENVKTVVDELTVGFSASVVTRANDALITSKVKASLVDAKDVQAHAYKIVTEKGVVYLMGRVTEREADRAAQIARGVAGVVKVVKVFEIVSEGELNATQPKAPAS